MLQLLFTWAENKTEIESWMAFVSTYPQVNGFLCCCFKLVLYLLVSNSAQQTLSIIVIQANFFTYLKINKNDF